MLLEIIKQKLVLILGVLCAVLFIMNIASCGNYYQQRGARQKEMATRLDLEEKMSKVGREQQAREAKLKAAEKALEEEKAGHEAADRALIQEQAVNNSLKEELGKVTKQKEALDQQLRDLAAKGIKQAKR
jgi:predicted Holliday junction resolvase-like endonuclease